MPQPIAFLHAPLALLLVVVIPGSMVAADLDILREVTARCVPDRLVIGSDNLTTWTLIDDPWAHRPEDIVLTQDHLDRMRVCWAPVPTDGKVIGDGGLRQSPLPRRQQLSDDQVLTYPVEVILPGWRALAGPSAPPPGRVLLWWRLGSTWLTSKVTVTLALADAGAVVPIPTAPTWQPIPYGLDAAFGSHAAHANHTEQETVSLDGELVASVTRIAAAYDRPEVWRSAVIEWTRLPDQPGALTTVYSPLQAGMKIPEQLTTGNVAANTLPREVRFPVSEALRDPRTGAVAPGRYRIRLAMAWNESSAANPGEPSTLSTIRSPAQTVRVLAKHDPAPARCPICGAVSDGRNPE